MAKGGATSPIPKIRVTAMDKGEFMASDAEEEEEVKKAGAIFKLHASRLSASASVQ